MKKEAKALAEQRDKEEAEQKKRKEREDFLNRYTEKSEYGDVVVLVIDESNKPRQDIAQKITSQISSQGFKLTTSFFTNQFVTDKLFEKIFIGEGIEEIKKLELSKYISHIVLGKKSVNFTEYPQRENQISAEVIIEIRIVSPNTGMIVNSFTVSEVGAWFSKIIAEDRAIKRICKKLLEENWSII